jgi:probable rRNA maturation factor
LKPRLSVSVTDERGRPIRSGGLGRWLAGAAPARARGHVAIALVPDRVMRDLNRRYHHVDRATDVLSFRIQKMPGKARGSSALRALPGIFLGDIAIALGVARRQAREQGHSLQTELRVLALHGLLHLLGYDHEVDQGQMQRTEDRLRRRAGLPLGLLKRSSAAPKPKAEVGR